MDLHIVYAETHYHSGHRLDAALYGDSLQKHGATHSMFQQGKETQMNHNFYFTGCENDPK